MVHLVGLTLSTLAMAQYSRGFLSSSSPPLLRHAHAPYAAFAVRPTARARNPLVRRRSSSLRSSRQHVCCRPLHTTTVMSCDTTGAAEKGDGGRSDAMGTSMPLGKLGRGNEIFSLAPMMEYTDRHMRFMLRLLTTRTVLWTEMVPSTTITYNADDLGRFLAYNDDVEHPVVLQVGGSDPKFVKDACRLARPYNYDAINLNCGCPSEKVAGKGAFGAALMRTPSLVSELCLAMNEGAGGDTPITVKCRIGVGDDDSYEQLATFIDEVNGRGGVDHFVIHARKAILGGLSPAQNRSIPPLRYDYVYRLVKDFPDVDFTLNGGVNTYEEALSCLEQGAHGVMVGRSWTNTPWYWSQADSKLFGTKDPGLSRREVIDRYGEYGERQEAAAGERWLNCRRRLAKPVWNLFHGEQGGKRFRVHLESQLKSKRSFGDILRESLLEMPQEQVDLLPGQALPPRERRDDGVRTQVQDDGIGLRQLDLDPSCIESSRVAA